LGIGGLLAAGSAIVSECANDRRRDMAVALMVAGYPAGAAFGGIIASATLEATGRWQAIFEVGAIATAALIIPVVLYVPESIAYLCERQSKGALQRVNAILSQFGRSAVSDIPHPVPAASTAGFIRLFEPGIGAVTLTLTVAFFTHMMTFYFLMKWIPKLVVDIGHPVASANGVLVWTNLAGATGSLLMSLLTQRYRVQRIVIVAMVAGSSAVLVFGQGFESLWTLSCVAVAAGFFTTGASAGFYALMARSFPARIRARGAGFVIGVGRAGAAGGPVAAGLLFSAGWPLSWVAAIMACGCLVAAVAISGSAFRQG
jgi:MFS family permease